MVTAVWRADTGSLYKGIDAQQVAEEIAALGEAVTPDQIVERAKDKNCELHKCFTWDNRVAADKWRKYEARQIFCNLIIKPVVVEEGKAPVRVFYKNDNNGYKQSEMIFKVDNEREKLLQFALRELQSIKRKYQTLNELSYIWDLIN